MACGLGQSPTRAGRPIRDGHRRNLRSPHVATERSSPDGAAVTSLGEVAARLKVMFKTFKKRQVMWRNANGRFLHTLACCREVTCLRAVEVTWLLLDGLACRAGGPECGHARRFAPLLQTEALAEPPNLVLLCPLVPCLALLFSSQDHWPVSVNQLSPVLASRRSTMGNICPCLGRDKHVPLLPENFSDGWGNYGYAVAKNGRDHMEDAVDVKSNVGGFEYLAVFDGHGGDQAVTYVKKLLPTVLEKHLKENSDIEQCIYAAFLR